MSITLPFHFLGDDGLDPAHAGKKAASLHELVRAGHPVPPGFIIDWALRDQVSSLVNALADAVTRVGGFPVAVRSSANAEDLEDASFAGMYETVLNVATLADLTRCIAQCFASATSPRVREYLAKRGIAGKNIHGNDLRMSVLVQAMAQSRCAGVFFTLHPLSGKEEEGLIEVCDGLGDRLVAAQVTPTRYVVDMMAETVLTAELSAEGELLSADEVRALIRAGIAIQAQFGAPQDIEWAYGRDGGLVILQSRPITALKWRSDVDEFTNADFKDGGVSARVCTPLMYSLYEGAMQVSMQQYFTAIKLLPKDAPQKSWIRCFYGRAYWNASEVKRRLLRIPGFDERAFDADLGIQKDYGEAGPMRVPMSLRTILPVIPVALALERAYDAQLARTRGYGERFAAKERRFRAALAVLEGASLTKLAPIVSEILALQHRTEIDYFTTIYNNANLQSDFRRLIDRVAKVTGHKPSIVKLLSGLEDVSHLKIQAGLLHLVKTARRGAIGSPAWLRARAEYLSDNYYHADAELDMMCPRWEDEPARVDAMVKAMLKSPEQLRDPERSAANQRHQFETERAAVLAALDRSLRSRLRLKGKFVRELARARTYLRRREEMREYSTRAYHLVRRAALLLGRKLVEAGVFTEASDALFLRAAEIQDICASPSDEAAIRRICAAIGRRQLYYQGYRNFTPPNELGGCVLVRREESAQSTGADGKAVLRGLGCSPGQITGRVRVVETLSEAFALEADEILVTRFTDPGWTPVLGMVSGVITEVGGLLSHAAVIGREYGIPAILNLPGATKALRTGQVIVMNGETGEIVFQP